MKKFTTSKLPVIFSIITLIFMLFCSYVYPMSSSEVMEYEGKIVNIDLLIPTTTDTVTLYDMEVLRVFIHPEQIIPNYYVVVRYNDGDGYEGKSFILPCKYIVYIKEIKNKE